MSAAHLGFPTETVVVFVVMAVGAMFIDLFMHRHDKPISLKSAAMWSIFWVMMAMAFAGFLYVHHGAEMASLFPHRLCTGRGALRRQPVCDDGDLRLARRAG